MPLHELDTDFVRLINSNCLHLGLSCLTGVQTRHFAVAADRYSSGRNLLLFVVCIETNTSTFLYFAYSGFDSEFWLPLSSQETNSTATKNVKNALFA